MTAMDVPSAATLIRCKRDGQRLDAKQLRIIARGIASGDWSEGQVGAFAMALAWRGMTIDECREFTFALRDSGQSLRWDDLPGPVLDKHSTGGVGDCVSLVLAPLLAACGAYVPMISGRGLGHTGGTLSNSKACRDTTSIRPTGGCARPLPISVARSSARAMTWCRPTAVSTACAMSPPRWTC